MKAIVYTKFGPPEVLQYQEINTPVPDDNEILIKIAVTTVAAEDPGMRSSPGLNGFGKPKKNILGFYLAGEVVSTGKNVRRFKIGDQVYGNTGLKILGTYAEYICMPEDGALVIKPENITFEEAVALPNGMLTALPFLRDQGKIKEGQKILINGASGAVGTAAIQLAKHFGAEVTGVCSSRNLSLIESLGVDNAIDYTIEDFTKSDQTYDIIFDVAGKSSFSDCKHLLNEGGVFLTTVPTPAIMVQMFRSSIIGSKKVKFMATGLRSPKDKIKDLEFTNSLIEQGKIKAVIDRRFPLNQIADAHKYVETGRKRGNVVITVA